MTPKTTELKLNDVMVGDWVCHKKTKDIIWIFEIDADRGVVNNEADGYCSERNISINDIEPIPLTVEILEKNGFRYDYDVDECITDDGRSITIKGYTYKEEEKGILIDYFNGHIKATTFNIEVSKDINYIHELQHILRICNIEKQIKL